MSSYISLLPNNNNIPVPAVFSGTLKGKRGLLSKHVHYQLALCNKLWYYFLPLIMIIILRRRIIRYDSLGIISNEGIK